MEETVVVVSGTMFLYLRTSLMQEVLEKLFEPLKGCGRISMKMRIGNGSEFSSFALIISYTCDVPE